MLLFVYGTMKQQCRNYPRLHELGAIRVGHEFLTNDAFTLHLGHRNKAPLAIRDSFTGVSVGGELYAIEDEKIGDIDVCEGHPLTYERQRVVLANFNEHNGLAVYMYVYKGPLFLQDRRILPDGDGVLRFDPLLVT